MMSWGLRRRRLRPHDAEVRRDSERAASARGRFALAAERGFASLT